MKAAECDIRFIFKHISTKEVRKLRQVCLSLVFGSARKERSSVWEYAHSKSQDTRPSDKILIILCFPRVASEIQTRFNIGIRSCWRKAGSEDNAAINENLVWTLKKQMT